MPGRFLAAVPAVLATLLAVALPAMAAEVPAIDWQADGKDIRAAGLPADASVVLRLIGPGRGVRSVDDWLVAYADRDAPTLGRLVAARPVTPAGAASRMTLREVTGPSGTSIAAYVGRTMPDGTTVVACRITISQGAIADYSGPALLTCLKQLDGLAASGDAAPAGRTTAAAPPLAPGGGLGSAAIAEVLFVFEMPTFDPFSGTLKGDDDTFLLLRDGSFYFNFNVAPALFDVAALRRANPRRWGRWQRSGDTVNLAWDDGRRQTLATTDGTYVKPCRPARPGETLDQTLSMMSGTSVGLPGNQTTTSTSRSLTFRPDGSFGNRGGTVGLTPNTTVGTSSGGTGRYRLDGYTLVLDHADGRTEQRMYCRVEAGAVVINGVQYIRR